MTAYVHQKAVDPHVPELPPLAGHTCAVRGCSRESRFAVERVMSKCKVAKVVVLGYCAHHYGGRPGR